MAANAPTFAVASRGKIQSYIDSGVLKYPSYVLCKNENTLVFIDSNLQMQDIKGYGQASIFTVEELPTNNIQNNTFYICNGIGYLFIDGVPVPVFKDISKHTTSYNDLADTPITNVVGSVGSPITLSELGNGSYNVSGDYIIGGNLETIFVSSKTTMFLIDSDTEFKYITKLGAKNVCIYKINLSSMDVVEDTYLTQSWISAQGYTTKNYVDEAIEALYQKIASEVFVPITKVSQLENDMGYLTASDLGEFSNNDIAKLF